jgi:predicted acyltransferase
LRTLEAQRRIEAIDQFRGLAIVLMVIANYLADVQTVPGWLKHAPDVGLTPIDLIAPFFIFAIGLTFGPSYRRRVRRDGRAAAVGHFLRRFLALVGIGAIISAGEIAVGHAGAQISWGVLQAIGMAGIATLLVLELPPLARAIVGAAALACYQLLLDSFWLPAVLRSEHGGIQGALSWAGMLMICTSMCDFWHGDRRSELRIALPSLLALAAGVGLSFVAPISKNRVSASYALVGLGASGLLFSLALAVVERLRLRSAFLAWWGRNPILLYVLHYLLLALFVLPSVPWWHDQAPPLLVVAQCAFLLAALGLCAWLLARRRLTVSL